MPKLVVLSVVPSTSSTPPIIFPLNMSFIINLKLIP